MRVHMLYQNTFKIMVLSTFKNTVSEYLSLGEKKFEKLKEELKKAKHYIFLEYFIINEGIMWDSILDILLEKSGKE